MEGAVSERFAVPSRLGRFVAYGLVGWCGEVLVTGIHDYIRHRDWSFLDDLIDPADTRATIVRGLELSETKQVERPWRKHGVLPV
jgi:hypothetical protein